MLVLLLFVWNFGATHIAQNNFFAINNLYYLSLLYVIECSEDLPSTNSANFIVHLSISFHILINANYHYI